MAFDGEGGLEDNFINNGWSVYTYNIAGSNFSYLRKVVNIVLQNNIDIICTHFKRSLLIGNTAAILLNKKCIHFEHSNPELGCNSVLKRFLSRIAIRKSQVVIANSQYTKGKCTSFYPKGTNIKTIYNPVVADSNDNSITSINDSIKNIQDYYIFFHVGGLTTWRDQKTLILAFNLFKKRNPFALTKLLIVGDGPMRNELERLVKNLHEDDVVFLGYKKNVFPYYKIANCYINPAIDEGFGIAVAEAMLYKLPVILADKGAHPELIDSRTGILYRSGNEKDLSRYMDFIYKNKELATNMGKEAHHRASTIFSPEQYALNIKNTLISHSVKPA